MLVTNGGQLIRTSVTDIRIAGRSTRGVTLFRVAEDEHVVSVAHMIDVEDDEEGEDEAETEPPATGNGALGPNGSNGAAPPQEAQGGGEENDDG